MKYSKVVAYGLLTGVCSLAISGTAFAQQQGNQSEKEAAEEPGIVVTGSRLIQTGDDSPTPLTVVGVEDILTSTPSTISDAVNNLPVFSAPRGQVSNPNTGIGAGGGGNAVANQLNLRNLLPQRTLILFDGHRVAPTTSTGIVDVDTIPQYLLKRVEVVTGGVSAVYGSDAISGVVNFITDKDFNGGKAHIQSGISDRGDGHTWQAGGAYGTRIGDRGHVEVSYEYREDQGISQRSSRPEFWRWTIANNGASAANAMYLTGDAVRTDIGFYGLVRSGVLAGTTGAQFLADGVLTPRVLGTATSSGVMRIGGDGAWYDGSLKAAQRSHQVFARLDYELSDSIDFYVEGAANFKRNAFWGQNLQILAVPGNIQISRDNFFLPAAYRTQMVNAGQTTFQFSRVYQDPNLRIRPVIDETQVFVNTALQGRLGTNWKWELGYVHSQTKLANTEYNNVNNRKLLAALDAVNDGTGRPVCYAATQAATAAEFASCVPLNAFGPTATTQAMLDYILETTHFTAWTKQDNVMGNIAGSPFSTWAGDVQVALSGEWRHQSYRSVSDADTVAIGAAACTNLRFACSPTSTQGWFQTFPNRSTVSQSVTEAALEVKVPLLNDSPLAERLDVTGAARWTHYDTTGTYWTWKVGIDWALMDSLRFRATRSRDIRAPTLDDLFASPSCFPANATDSLTNQSSTAVDCTIANPTLTSEVGNTLTLGAVFTPEFLPGFSTSFDYYDIKISNAITTVVGTNATIQTACYASGGSSIYCSLQDRALGSYTNTSTANVVTNWRRQPFNIAEVTTAGFDWEMNYANRLFNRPFSLRTMVTYQPHVKFVQPSLVTLDMGGVAFGQNGTQANPRWRVAAFLNFSPVDNVTVSIMERWRSAMKLSADPNQIISTDATKVTTVPAYATTNLNLAYKIKAGSNDAEVFFNVQNLFDKIGPPANFQGSQVNIGLFGGFAIGDDPVGRYFTAGFKLKF